jgi:RNA polymerase sigma factor (sigma-70 family)
VGQRNPETEIGEGPGAFQSTLWSVVLRAKDPSSPERRKALEKLIQTYWKPLYFFVRRKGKNAEESKDLTQGFFAELLAKDYLKTLDPERGKFRAFLLSAFKHYLADHYDHDRAQKRGGGRPVLSLDFEGAETEAAGVQTDSEPDRAYQRDWALQVMARALERLRGWFETAGRSAEFQALKGHLASTHPEGTSYEDIAKALGTNVEQVRNGVRAARARYRDAILEVIRDYTDGDADAKEELADLMSAFS